MELQILTPYSDYSLLWDISCLLKKRKKIQVHHITLLLRYKALPAMDTIKIFEIFFSGICFAVHAPSLSLFFKCFPNCHFLALYLILQVRPAADL